MFSIIIFFLHELDYLFFPLLFWSDSAEASLQSALLKKAIYFIPKQLHAFKKHPRRKLKDITAKKKPLRSLMLKLTQCY